MKPRFEQPGGDGASSEQLHSQIADTREKMDHTLNEIGERMTPRHLLDDLLDFFSSHRPDKEKVKQKAGAAVSRIGSSARHRTETVVDVVREHPIPSLLIGAGIAYAFYERHRETSPSMDADETPSFGAGGYEQGEESSGALEESAGGAAQALASAKQTVQEQASAVGEHLREKTERARGMARQQAERIRGKANDLSRKAADGAQRAYRAGRDSFAQAKDEHPVATGLGFLAMGVLAGLLLPHSRPEDEWMGTLSDQVKNRAGGKGREFIERGKEVAAAAASAARQEAAAQGFTSDRGQGSAEGGAAADREEPAANPGEQQAPAGSPPP